MRFFPYGIYYPFTEALRAQVALIITLVLFSILVFWTLVTEPLSACKVRQVLSALEQVHTSD